MTSPEYSVQYQESQNQLRMTVLKRIIYLNETVNYKKHENNDI